MNQPAAVRTDSKMNAMSFWTRALHKLSISAVTGVAMAGSLLCGTASIGATLPVPCAPGACAPNKTPGFGTAPAGFVTSGQATATQSGNTLTVKQSSSQAILNWASFNVSADGKVAFQQPNATSIALNKIYQSNPSSIFGQLSANGQIYLINGNGFVFGPKATVNVAGLVASSLGLFHGDDELATGILAPLKDSPANPALKSDQIYVTDSSGTVVLDAQGKPQPVQIVIQPGAQITATGGGRLMLAGQNVVNGGSLSAPDGQIVLAAGQSVYLAASADPSMRGLVVEVSSNDPSSGTASNQAGGILSAPRGNVSLIGMAVNQNGRISATTAVSANGSVILQAANGGPLGCQSNEVLCATQGGTLKVGASSEIDVLPDLTDTSTAVVGQKQIQSSIQLAGQQVDIEGGQINAPGGTLNVVAAANPDAGLLTEGNSAAQIRVAAGTSINLAGSNAQLPMSANLLTIQLRGNELEDDPVQRNGALSGQTVIVDIRAGKPAIISEASWQSALQGIQENILQRTSVGGTANFKSEGDVVVNNGAKIDVSGGKWTYGAGTTQTSQLIAVGGKTFDISTADPSLTYLGVRNPTYTQTYNGFGVQIIQPTPGLGHYQSGYADGFSAGTVSFAAPAMALQGTLLGTAVNGPYQRGAATIPTESLLGYLASQHIIPGNGMATGGTLIIGDPSIAATSSAGLPYFFSPALSFASDVAPIIVAEGTPLPSQTLQLPVSYITSGGFTQTKIYDDSTVTLPAGLPLNLGVGSSLLVVAPRTAIESSIQALGGSIDLQTAQTADSAIVGVPRLGIDIGAGVTLDVRGQWTNESRYAFPTGVAPTFQDGGSINLALTSAYSKTTSGGELVLGDGVSLLASGGAWVKSNNTIVGGTGGSIVLDASPYESALEIGNGVALSAFGVDGALGGRFSLGAPRIAVSQGDGRWAGGQRIDELLDPGQVFGIGAALFSQYGFSNISLTATTSVLPDATDKDVLRVNAGTTINAQAQTLQLNSSYLTRQTGGTVQAFSQLATLPEANRQPGSISLKVLPAGAAPDGIVVGNLDIQTGASITADAKSTINLVGEGSILIDGVLRTHGGSILAQIATPTTLTDPGYLPDQHLELGSTATLDVSGTTLLTPNNLNLTLGTVLAGGSVSLVADRGDVIANAGSSIDISGASAQLDVQQISGSGRYGATMLGSAGGSLVVQSSESVSLLGNLSAAAGASSAGRLAGGSLEVDLSRVFADLGSLSPATGAQAFPTLPLTIELVSSAAGSNPTASYGDLAVLGVAQLEQSGIDVLKLRADDTIALNSNTPLSLAREISIDAPNISVSYGTNAALIAPYLVLTDSNGQVPHPEPVLGGTGSLSLSADQIVLSGLTRLQGVGTATFTSSGDVEFEPFASNQLAGSLSLDGNLTINAARLYPATQTSFTIIDSASTGIVAIGRTNTSPGTPLAVAGSLTIDAANIVSSGTILAPFGQITLAATNSLALLDGSVTSVSADGAVLPYGQTVLGGTQWVYNSSIPVDGVPNRQVSLIAPNVSFASGAKIDLSGGGDLSAYEWVPGTGGSRDALSQADAKAAGLYAVLPSTRGQYAAYDVQEFSGSAVGAGESVYLSGVAGLPAGVYPLLPARYGLLPGAYLVQVEPGFQSLKTGTIGALADGTPVVAGYVSFGNTGLQNAAGYVGFAVRPGSYSQSLAQYQISNASAYFSAAAARAGKTQVVLPADAGTLLLAAGASLNALGKVNTAAGSGGSAATIEIDVSDLTVTRDAQTVAASGVSIAAPVLQSWNAGDLILGGRLSEDGSSVSVSASTVTIAQGAQFSAGQVLAVADHAIDVEAGATVASTSGMSGTALKTLPLDAPLKLTLADGNTSDTGAALLAVSDRGLPIVNRTAAGGSGSATINVDGTLSTRGAVALDAPAGIAVAGTINAPGASWSLGSDSIAFTGAGAPSSDTLQINSALLSQMQTAGAIRLASAGGIDLLTDVTLGATSASSAPTLHSLSLIAASINNLAGGTAVFGGETLTLQGTGTLPPAPTAGAGNLTLVADTLEIGAGNLAINGNSQIILQATGAVVGKDTAPLEIGALGTAVLHPGVLGIAGNVTIAAAELTAASHSDTTIAIPDGTLTIRQNGTAASASTLATSLGGKLALTANQIQDSGSIIVPGGRISLEATPGAGSAAAASSITLTSNALINASGITVSAGDQIVGAAGGIVNIKAAGDLTLPSGASISVAGAGHSPAGFLSLTGGGVVTLNGTLAGNAATDAIGGSFALDAGQLIGGLPALASNLTKGGFTNEIDVRARNGDLDSAAGTTLAANRINLTADNGVIDIAGTVSAPSAGLRGSIGLFAGNGLVLESTSALLANGSGSTGRGGEIELSTTRGAITLDSGSVISASGQAQSGSLLLRAPALVNTGDVAISNIASTVTGMGQITIEPVLAPIQSSGDLATDFNQQIQTLVSSYLNQATSVIAARFHTTDSPPPGGPSVVLEPGVVVQAQNDLTVSQSLDLYALQQSGQLGAPIDLTVQAKGNITINGSISDGVSAGGAFSSTPSSSLRFVAGADLNSANPLAVVAKGAANPGADLTLTSGAFVRTGTGDINLVASNDVIVNAGASAYTMGIPGADPVTIRLGGTVPINFLTGGGNVVVTAGEDVLGQDQLDPQSASSWQARNVKAGLGYYGLNLTAFDRHPWSLATFGGGDLSITAGRDVVDVAAATADSLALVGSTQTHFTGGGLTVEAGRDITTGQFFIADGIGSLTAGRSFAASPNTQGGPSPVGSLFAIENSRVSLWAQDAITVDGVVNPTVLKQPLATSTVANVTFFTYGADSAFNAQSTSGNVTLNNDTPHDAQQLLGSAATVDDPSTWSVLPPSLKLVSLTQDLLLSADTLYPSDNGQLQLFAGRDIVTGAISMSDAPDVAIPTVAAPTSGLKGLADLLPSNGTLYDFFSDRHVNDTTPASIVAGRDINGLALTLPKASRIEADRDIVNLQYNGQNLNATDLTLISAGRDFIDPPAIGQNGQVSTSASGVVVVGGPGRLDILAGRDINLGFSVGVITQGNLKNPNLSTPSGADITMLAGLGQNPDYTTFFQKIIEPSAAYQEELVSYVDMLTGQRNLSLAQAEADFAAFTPDEQRPLIDQVFFNELDQSGLEAGKSRSRGFTRGYAAIDALFPGSRTADSGSAGAPYRGDLDLTYSGIYTLAGGGISLLVPGGAINVGLANPPAGGLAKSPSQLGIVAQGAGDVNIYSKNDVNVNSSRVFTLGGGNILVWSNDGSIDAGNGAKTSLSLPPPTYSTDKFGNAELVFNAAVAGSGIRTIRTVPSVPAGNVNLIAPVGAVNAGDAGIGAAGNINIAAVTVTGVANINFGGTATGVPALVSNLTASLSGAASAASATTTATTALEGSGGNKEEAAPLAQSAISWLDVFVTGLGEDNCKPDDSECLKRQKHE
jgi:filamentous hemagglutinin